MTGVSWGVVDPVWLSSSLLDFRVPQVPPGPRGWWFLSSADGEVTYRGLSRTEDRRSYFCKDTGETQPSNPQRERPSSALSFTKEVRVEGRRTRPLPRPAPFRKIVGEYRRAPTVPTAGAGWVAPGEAVTGPSQGFKTHRSRSAATGRVREDGYRVSGPPRRIGIRSYFPRPLMTHSRG